ncbi:hypothetical protein DP64_07620 [Stutzerimonas degradans]|nr:hypothetical protein DP64_07620 [Stutzerimonas degradans]
MGEQCETQWLPRRVTARTQGRDAINILDFDRSLQPFQADALSSCRQLLLESSNVCLKPIVFDVPLHTMMYLSMTVRTHRPNVTRMVQATIGETVYVVWLKVRRTVSLNEWGRFFTALALTIGSF